MKSKISVIFGSVLALTITATEPMHAKGCDCIGPNLSADKPVPKPPQVPVNSAPRDRDAGGHGYRVAGGHR
jgi:hypothetical protein